jgi:hypothetical protein
MENEAQGNLKQVVGKGRLHWQHLLAITSANATVLTLATSGEASKIGSFLIATASKEYRVTLLALSR